MEAKENVATDATRSLIPSVCILSFMLPLPLSVSACTFLASNWSNSQKKNKSSRASVRKAVRCVRENKLARAEPAFSHHCSNRATKQLEKEFHRDFTPSPVKIDSRKRFFTFLNIFSINLERGGGVEALWKCTQGSDVRGLGMEICRT